MGKNKKKSNKNNVEDGKEVKDTMNPAVENGDINKFESYKPGFLSNMLSSKTIESNPYFEVSSDEEDIEVNSEEEKSWNPFDDDSMDENVSKAFEEMQKHPDKWMKKLEEEMDSEGSSSSEEEEEEEESEESEEKVEEKVEEEEESEESEESAIESEEEEEEEEEEEDMNEEEEEEDKEREMSEKEIQRQQKREQLKQQGKDEKQAIHKLNPALSIFVKGVSYSYEEASFRKLFKECGDISNLFMVRRNDGRFAGYGAVEFATVKGKNAAKKLDGVEYLGRSIGVSDLEDPSMLDRQGRRKEKKKEKKQERKAMMKKKEKKEKKEKKGMKGMKGNRK